MTATDLLAHYLFRIGTTCRIRGLLLKELAYLRQRNCIPNGIGVVDILRRPERVEIPLRVARFINPKSAVHLIDVGANDGRWAHRFLDSFPNSTAELWEPLPALAEILRTGFPDRDRVEIVPAAASTTSGRAHMVAPQHHAMASLHAYSDFITNSPLHGESQTVDIATRRLDDMQRSLGDRVVVLKVDAQGHELEVLDGAASTLNLVSLAIVEASVGQVFKGKPPTFASVCCIMSKHGLFPCMFPSAGTMFGNHPVEQDIIFVRQPALHALTETA